MTQKPLLIAVEGCDGTGKTTLVAALVQAFLSLGILAASIKRPAKDALAAFYVQGQTVTNAQVLTKMNADCMAALWQAGDLRRQGTPIVIFDRHYISAAIYQGGDDLDWPDEFVRQRDMWGEPDAWVHCDSNGESVINRLRSRPNDIDKKVKKSTIDVRLNRYRHFVKSLSSPVVEYWSLGPSVMFKDPCWSIPPCGTTTNTRIMGEGSDCVEAAGHVARIILEVTK